jgi:site-specific DNA-methyltransferase (adenine-specific)
MKRLQEHEYVVTVQDDEWWKHRESQVGPAFQLIEAVPSSGGISGVRATRSAVIRSGLHNLDCFDGLPRIESASVQLVLTDLPTGATANNWDTPLDLEALWQELKRILKPNGAVVMFAHFPFDKTLAMSNLPWLKHEYVLQKSKATGFLHAKDAPLRTHELVLVFAPATPLYNPQMTPVEPYVKKNGAAKRSPNYFGNRAGYVTVNSGLRHPTTVLQFAADADRIHPTQKPLKLVEALLRTYSNPGDVVCDPCAGSASTAIAVMNASRQFVGFERDKAMFERAAKRICEHAKKISDSEKTG